MKVINYNRIYKLLILSTVFIFSSIFLNGFYGLLFFSLSAISMLLLFISSMSLWQGWSKPLILFSGFALMLVSTLFDVGSTLYYSPTLDMEANPFARILLDGGVSYRVVIFLGVVFQSLFLWFSFLIWSNFCFVFNEYVGRLKSGGGWLFQRMYGMGPGIAGLIGKVDPFMFIAGIAPLFIAVFLCRIYLGLEWHGIVPVSRVWAPGLIIVFVSLFQYLVIRKMANN